MGRITFDHIVSAAQYIVIYPFITIIWAKQKPIKQQQNLNKSILLSLRPEQKLSVVQNNKTERRGVLGIMNEL